MCRSSPVKGFFISPFEIFVNIVTVMNRRFGEMIVAAGSALHRHIESSLAMNVFGIGGAMADAFGVVAESGRAMSSGGIEEMQRDWERMEKMYCSRRIVLMREVAVEAEPEGERPLDVHPVEAPGRGEALFRNVLNFARQNLVSLEVMLRQCCASRVVVMVLFIYVVEAMLRLLSVIKTSDSAIGSLSFPTAPLNLS